jgi:hypothetical protein
MIAEHRTQEMRDEEIKETKTLEDLSFFQLSDLIDKHFQAVNIFQHILSPQMSFPTKHMIEKSPIFKYCVLEAVEYERARINVITEYRYEKFKDQEKINGI